MPLTLLVLIPAKPGQADALEAALKGLLAPTRAEQGCISYDAHRSKDDPNLFLMYETWESDAALDKHFEQPHMVDAVAKLPDLVVGGLNLQKFTKLS